MTTTTVTTDPLAPQALQRHAIELMARDFWSREELDDLHQRRLRHLLEDVVEKSPYYREALGRDAAGAKLTDLPTLPKSVLMEEFDDIVTDPRLRRQDLENFLGAADAGELFLDEYRIFSTSGTSGLAGLFVYSRDEFAHWAGVFLRSLFRLGVTGDTRVTAIGRTEPIPSLPPDRCRPARRSSRGTKVGGDYSPSRDHRCTERVPARGTSSAIPRSSPFWPRSNSAAWISLHGWW